MKKASTFLCVLVFVLVPCLGCKKQESSLNSKSESQYVIDSSEKINTEKMRKPNESALDFDFKVVPETFELIAYVGGKELFVSHPGEMKIVDEYSSNSDTYSWIYPTEKMRVKISKLTNSLEIEFEYLGLKETNYIWPVISHENYTIPIGEGKFIENDDLDYSKYLFGKRMDLTESLSMPFFAGGEDDYAVIYMLNGDYNQTAIFNETDSIAFSLSHFFSKTESSKKYKITVFISENDPVNISKTYRNKLIEEKKFVSLAKKVEANGNIAKLIGAVHIYLFDMNVITPNDINWIELKNNIDSKYVAWIKQLAVSKTDLGEKFAVAVDSIAAGNADYDQKVLFCQTLCELLMNPKFYNEQIFTEANKTSSDLLSKGLNELSDSEIIQLNKNSLYANIPGVFSEVSAWSYNNNAGLIKAIKSAGIDRAWIGLGDWRQAYINPSLVSAAVDAGYLIAPCDSYHSIHKSGQEQLLTAAFPDESLYDRATIESKNGEKVTEFRGNGRILNSTLVLPSVVSRSNEILDNIPNFNSWFLDRDATGEVYDDYSQNHMTSKAYDINERLTRLGYFSRERRMVVGSEGGNDFAAHAIAFAHGIELPSFEWMDQYNNKKELNKHYQGRYYFDDIGTTKSIMDQVQMEEEYKKLFLNPRTTVPLYKLVYNDSVITSYHWDWPTLKIRDEVKFRELYEIFYNVPPMYYLNAQEWEKNSDEIIDHVKEWAESTKKFNREMTDFRILSEDRMVQSVTYGKDEKIIANFSDKEFEYKGKNIEPMGYILVAE